MPLLQLPAAFFSKFGNDMLEPFLHQFATTFSLILNFSQAIIIFLNNSSFKIKSNSISFFNDV